MPRFFTDALRFDTETNRGQAVLDGEDGRHISRSLRMRVGETLTVSDGAGLDYAGEIEEITGDTVYVRLTGQIKNTSEPTLRVTLYPGMPIFQYFKYCIIFNYIIFCSGYCSYIIS